MLVSDAGAAVEVAGLAVDTRSAVVHNLTVNRLHTYYVTYGDTSILSHNDSCGSTAPYSRSLQGGTVTRTYKKFTPARKPGTIAGARLVKEKNHATGRTRAWMESYDHSGRVRQVHLKKPAGPYYMFNSVGGYIGRR